MTPYSNVHLTFAPVNYSPETLGSNTITTTNGVLFMNQFTSPMMEERDCYYAQ